MSDSIFAVLREQRTKENPVNEEQNPNPVENPVNEEQNPSSPATENPVENPVNEEQNPPSSENDTSEEIVTVACPHCGILETLNESGETELESCPYCGEEDLIERVVKVVRDGSVVKKKVKTKKTRLTAAQKQALAKARKKAHTASAEKARAKSNKVRSKKGLNDADYVECTECGWTGDVSELVDGCCPDCGACIKDTSEKCGAKKKKACSESVNDVLEAISNMTEEDLDALKEALKGE